MSTTQLTGTITKLFGTSGYLRDQEARLCWFHATDLQGVSFTELHIGDRVAFTRQRGYRHTGDEQASGQGIMGPQSQRAEDVRLVHVSEEMAR